MRFMGRPFQRELGYGAPRGLARPFRPPWAAAQRAKYRSLAVFPTAHRLNAISERSGCKVKGLTLAGRCGRIWPARRRFPSRTKPDPNSHGEDAENADQAGNPPGHRRPRSEGQHGFVNPPVYHASTVLYPTAEDQVAHRSRYQYGRRGTPTSEALENALAATRRRRLRRRRAAAVGPGGDFDRAASRSPAPATTSWSPTASTGRPAISATACSSAWASRPPITIR